MISTLWLLAIVGFAGVNVVAFAAFEHDKRQAIERRRRVPEADLLALAYFGGGLGALLGQRLLRHKTRKEPFRSALYMACAFNLVGLVVMVAFFLQ